MDDVPLFEELFGQFTEECKTVVIKYDHKISYFKEDSFIDYSVTGFNDSSSVYQFKDKLKKYGKVGIEHYRIRQKIVSVILSF